MYEAEDTTEAREALATALDNWTITALRTKYHRLRDRDAVLEAAVREAIEPTALVAATRILCDVVEDGTEQQRVAACEDVRALLPESPS